MKPKTLEQELEGIANALTGKNYYLALLNLKHVEEDGLISAAREDFVLIRNITAMVCQRAIEYHLQQAEQEYQEGNFLQAQHEIDNTEKYWREFFISASEKKTRGFSFKTRMQEITIRRSAFPTVAAFWFKQVQEHIDKSRYHSASADIDKIVRYAKKADINHFSIP